MKIWKDIPGYEGKYQVSNQGDVRSLNYLHTGQTKILSPDQIRTGYMRVTLYDDAKKKRLVHRLVMLAFVGYQDLVVNHQNGNKSDNRLENLEYSTLSENTRHSRYVLGNIPTPPRGERNGHARLTTEQVRTIREMHNGGQYSYVSLAKIFCVHKQTIAGIIQNKRWQHI